MQTRIYETDDEKTLITAAAQLLQDLGYTIEESEVKCGVIVCSRDRDVTDAGQVIGSIFLAVLTGVATPVDRNQKVLASCVTKPIDEKRIAVRITFQHMVWNTNNQMTKCEQINDPKIYQEFFSKLSKSVFLTAHEI
jgi:response regulator RpfG family c-di-GMP phosphodiesterase